MGWKRYREHEATAVVSIITADRNGIWHGACAWRLAQYAERGSAVTTASYSPRGTWAAFCDCQIERKV